MLSLVSGDSCKTSLTNYETLSVQLFGLLVIWNNDKLVVFMVLLYFASEVTCKKKVNKCFTKSYNKKHFIPVLCSVLGHCLYSNVVSLFQPLYKIQTSGRILFGSLKELTWSSICDLLRTERSQTILRVRYCPLISVLKASVLYLSLSG